MELGGFRVWDCGRRVKDVGFVWWIGGNGSWVLEGKVVRESCIVGLGVDRGRR